MTFDLNLSEYQPYKTMGQSCQLKDIMEFHINWPKLVTASTLTNSNLIMRYMRNNDIDRVIELWKDVYPEAYGSTHQFVFDSQWYEDNVFALLESEGGRSAFLHSSCLMGRNTFNIMIGMEKGYIHINGLFTRSKSFGFPETCAIARHSNTTFYGNPTEEVYKYGKDISWLTEMKEFFDCIKNDKPIQNGTVYDAYEVMSVVEQIYKDGGII